MSIKLEFAQTNPTAADAAGCLVLLHGFPFDHSMWDAQREAVETTWRVVAPDLPGHGRSPVAPAGAATVDATADAVVTLLDDLGISGPVVVGGLSMGGYVALAMAARHRERLRGLVLMDTRAEGDAPETARSREETAQKLDRTGQTEPIVQDMLTRLFSPVSHQRRADLVARAVDVMRRTPAAGVAATLRMLASRPDRTALLGEIAVPTLVVCGADDAITPPDGMRRLADAVPNARFVLVPEAGHMAPLENPAPVNDALTQFLDAIA